MCLMPRGELTTPVCRTAAGIRRSHATRSSFLGAPTSAECLRTCQHIDLGRVPRVLLERALHLAGAPLVGRSGDEALPGNRYRRCEARDQAHDRPRDWALHVVVLSRLRYHPTRAYAERRCAEGKTDREIKRCLKRYIARQLYRQLEAGPSTPGRPIGSTRRASYAR